jgi:F-type H+-transporting ATPase subunit epsilon
MTDKFAFDLVTPEKLLKSGDAEMVTIPGTEGDMGVMAGHMALISTLRPGMITVTGGSQGDERFFVSGGFAEVTAQKLTILAEEAVPANEFDSAALELRIAGAEEALNAAKSDMERTRAQLLLEQLRALRTMH